MPDLPPAPGPEAGARDRILHATLDLLESDGYPAVTTDAIAASARVSKATIYQFWPSKQHVVVEAARKRLGPVEPVDLGSFEAEIRWILERRLGDYREPGTLRMVGSLVGAATTDPQLRIVFEDWIQQLSDSILEVTRRGVTRGDVHPGVDEFALESLVAGVVARTVITQLSFEPSTVDELVRLISAAARAGR